MANILTRYGIFVYDCGIMTDEDKKTVPPPYLSVKKVAEVIEFVSSRPFKEAITTRTFTDRKFSLPDAALAVNMLKFLGLIDDGGEATPVMQKMRIKDESRKPEFAKIVKGAYKELFETDTPPYELPADKLHTEFGDAYKVSDRLIRSAIPVFLKMCEYAGFIEEKPVQRRTATSSGVIGKSLSPRKPSFTRIEKPRQNYSGLSVVPIEHLELHMPEELKNRLLTDEDVEVLWREARAAIKKLALADKKPQAPNSEEQRIE